MPFQPIIPIWGGLNNANSPSATGLVDPVTGQQYNTGGLEAGDYFDLTEKEANALSVTTTGLCHSGRYRYVKVDSGATAANVKTGTVGYLRAGSYMQNVLITAAGSGQTNGTYTIQANAGNGGTGASVTIVIAGGVITNAFVNTPGNGYVTPPTFTVAEGGTPGTLVAQLNTTPNVVTSYDQIAAGTSPGTVRPVVYLNSPTPGNFTFIQELGIATVLGNGTIGTAAVQNFISATTGGTVSSGTTFTVATLGQAIDLPEASQLFKIYMLAPVVQD
jgi:hypothetical protein